MAEWHVNGAASASGSGTGAATAFRTLAEAVAASRGGDTIRVAGGIYRETMSLSGKSGTLSNPTRVLGDPLDPFVISGGEALPGLVPCVLADAVYVGDNWSQMRKTTVSAGIFPGGDPYAGNLCEDGVQMPICVERADTTDDFFLTKAGYYHKADSITKSGSDITGFVKPSVTDLYTKAQIENAECNFVQGSNRAGVSAVTFDTTHEGHRARLPAALGRIEQRLQRLFRAVQPPAVHEGRRMGLPARRIRRDDLRPGLGRDRVFRPGDRPEPQRREPCRSGGLQDPPGVVRIGVGGASSRRQRNEALVHPRPRFRGQRQLRRRRIRGALCRRRERLSLPRLQDHAGAEHVGHVLPGRRGERGQLAAHAAGGRRLALRGRGHHRSVVGPDRHRPVHDGNGHLLRARGQQQAVQRRRDDQGRRVERRDGLRPLQVGRQGRRLAGRIRIFAGTSTTS